MCGNPRMANSQRNRSPEPKIGGAHGDVRDKTSNIAGTKSDRQMDTASHRGFKTVSGSKAGDKVRGQKLARSRSKRAA